MTPELIGISYSPWTEKAKWALDHHKIHYRYTEHLVMLGMPGLRLKTGRWSGDLTVPVLRSHARSYLDSFDIALAAEERGLGSPLFPKNLMEEIRRFNALSEDALDAGRALALAKVAASNQAMIEAIPPTFPKGLGPILLPVVKIGLRYISKEFEIDPGKHSEYERRLECALAKIRAALQSSRSKYVLGAFTYADIATSMSLQFVKPVRSPYLEIGSATHHAFTHSKLSEKYRDLIEWRDSLYEKHRTGDTGRPND